MPFDYNEEDRIVDNIYFPAGTLPDKVVTAADTLTAARGQIAAQLSFLLATFLAFFLYFIAVNRAAREAESAMRKRSVFNFVGNNEVQNEDRYLSWIRNVWNKSAVYSQE